MSSQTPKRIVSLVIVGIQHVFDDFARLGVEPRCNEPETDHVT